MSPWFPGNVKPVRVGYYQAKIGREKFLCFWDGSLWHAGKQPNSAGMGIASELPGEWRGKKSRPGLS